MVGLKKTVARSKFYRWWICLNDVLNGCERLVSRKSKNHRCQDGSAGFSDRWRCLNRRSSISRSLAAVSTGLAPPNIEADLLAAWESSAGLDRGCSCNLGRSFGSINTKMPVYVSYLGRVPVGLWASFFITSCWHLWPICTKPVTCRRKHKLSFSYVQKEEKMGFNMVQKTFICDN